MRRFRWMLFVPVLSMISCYAHAAGMTVVNGRYFSDASGTPKFLIGYQFQMLGSTVTDSCDTIGTEIDTYVPYGLNYLRTVVNQTYATASTTPPSCDGSTSRTPFLRTGEEANLDYWDDTFWTNLKADVVHAASHGIYMHISIFNAYGLGATEGGQNYEWPGSDFNVVNQTESFFGDLDKNSDGDAQDDGEFYDVAAFNAGTGVGYYQKRLIDKTIAELDGYNNVFYEVGNETAHYAWTQAVYDYMKTKTSKPVTTNTCEGNYNLCTPLARPGAFVDHRTGTVAGVKSDVAGIVGLGYPAWVDPDGGSLMDATPTEARQAAWYALTGGAFGWGGFDHDWFINGNITVDTTKLSYYGYLLSFLDNNAVRFWEMVPSQSLISTNTTNSLLANVGSQYLGYVLSGATVNITLGTGSYSVKYFNPATGATTTGSATTGPATRTFNRPSGAADWVVFVSNNTALSQKPNGKPKSPWGLKVVGGN